MKKHRKEFQQSAPERVIVDTTGFGRLNQVSVIQTGPALGHGIEIDSHTVEAVAAALEGITGNWGHGNLFSEDLASHLGAWENPAVENFVDSNGVDQVRVLGDFVFAESAHALFPDGLGVSAPSYIMKRAEEDPSTFGISIVADLALEHSLAEGDEDKDPVARLLDANDLKRGDIVSTPACNPVGLSAKKPSVEVRFNALLSEDSLAMAGLVEKALESRLTALNAEITGLRLENTNLKQNAIFARESEVEAFCDSLIVQSAERQSPISATQLESVRALFDIGQDALAKNMGEALLGACGVQPRFGQTLITTLEDKPEDPKVKSIRAQAAMLRHANPTKSYAISEDGLSIVETKKV